jgi:hypothetical protein
LLDHFRIDYQVIETNYHIFLLAKTSKGDVLFEATDPINGFISSAPEILHRIEQYRKNEIQPRVSSKIYYRYQFNLYNAVDLDELLGLTYYNLSIEAYNRQQYSLSISHLDRAAKLYHSSRIDELSRVILLTLAAKDLTQSEKENFVRKIQTLRQKLPGLAIGIAP